MIFYNKEEYICKFSPKFIDENLLVEGLKFNHEFYKSHNGSKPAEEFIMMEVQEDKAKAKILDNMRISRDDLSLAYKKQIVKKLDKYIFEVRTLYNKMCYRILFFIDGDKMISTNGFIKDTQKTPINEIEKANRYRSDYLKNKRG